MQVSAAGKTPLQTPENKPRQDPELKDLSRQLEASFLAQMLKHSGVGAPRETLGGGAGESQFSSFLVQEYADAIAEAGGVGLAESIYVSLVRSEART